MFRALLAHLQETLHDYRKSKNIKFITYEPFAFIARHSLSEQVRYCGVMSTGNAVWSPGHKVQTCKFWGTYSSFAESLGLLECVLYWLSTVTNISKHYSFISRIKHFTTYLPYWLSTVTNISKHYSFISRIKQFTTYLPYWLSTVTNIAKHNSFLIFRIKQFKTSWSSKCLMSEGNWLWSWGYQGSLVH
jgi:hypothetical protein